MPGALDCCHEHATQTLLACAVPRGRPPNGGRPRFPGAARPTAVDSRAVMVMDILVQRCAGLDIGKADLKACVRIPGERGRRKQEIRTFATATPALLQLRDWLRDNAVTVVGMEATGDYWKPVYYLLEDAFEVQLLNARHMRNIPGRKTDVADAGAGAYVVCRRSSRGHRCWPRRRRGRLSDETVRVRGACLARPRPAESRCTMIKALSRRGRFGSNRKQAELAGADAVLRPELFARMEQPSVVWRRVAWLQHVSDSCGTELRLPPVLLLINRHPLAPVATLQPSRPRSCSESEVRG